MQFKFFAMAALAVGAVAAAPQIAKNTPEIVEREAAITANTIIASLDTITDTATDALRIATTLNPFTIVFAVPRLVANFGRIVTAVGTDVTNFLNFDFDEPFSRESQQKISVSFRRFVQVWIDLLEAILARFSFLSGTPFIAPISAVIQVLGRGIITFAQAIINFIPEFKEEAVVEQQQLEQTFTVVIERFN